MVLYPRHEWRGFTVLLIKFLGILKSSREHKESYTTKVKPRINQLIDLINKHLVVEIEAELGKQALVIIDDLEKVSLEQAISIFHDHGHLLTSLTCNVVYTFPIALEYDLRMASIIGLFGDVIRLPNLKIRDRKGQPVAQNIELMREMVWRRIDAELIETGALDKAIEYSGGMIRELFHILFKACDKALNHNMSQITEEHVNSAIAQIRSHYIFSLKTDHYPYLLALFAKLTNQ